MFTLNTNESNKSLQKAFLFIMICSIFSAGSMIYFEWLDIQNDAGKELVYANQIMTKSIKSVFNKNEALLKILGERLVELGALHYPYTKSHKLIDDLLKSNPELAGIGLANLSGQLVLTSFNMNRNNLPNLLTSTVTSKTFKQALTTDSMVVGRTYYMKAIDEWVIPLRRRITDSSGKVIAVMTTGLKLNDAQALWSASSLPDHMRAMVVREDLYRQYVPSLAYGNINKAYSIPVSKKGLISFERLLLAQTNMDLKIFRKSGKIITMYAEYGKANTPVYTSFSYDPVHQHHTYIFTPTVVLYAKLIAPAAWLVILLIIFNISLYFIFRSNIRLQSSSRKELEFQATHDSLTGLPNRRYLLNEYHSWQKKYNDHYSVLFIDLNNFKAVNDLHGHSIGDIILLEVASRLQNIFENCLQIRHGGDEFIVLCKETDSAQVQFLCHSFLVELRQSILVGELEFSITASIGIVFSPKDGTDSEVLLRKADMAMYEAKKRQTSVHLFSEELEEQQKRKASIESELSHALERKEFHLVYQPQVDAKNYSVTGVEVLIRWHNFVLGRVSPGEFIEIAESTGLIVDIGLYVLETALSEISEMYEQNHLTNNITLSINVSVRQLLSDGLREYFTRIKNNINWNHISLVIEVTESLFIEDMDKIKIILEGIQQAGINISLDDFGTGYSSLSVLSKLPISELKIDKSFVDHIATSKTDKKLIRSIINLGKNLGISVLAEGVENEDQVTFLAKNGCDFFQGYYFSKPLRKEQLLDYIIQDSPSI